MCLKFFRSMSLNLILQTKGFDATIIELETHGRSCLVIFHVYLQQIQCIEKIKVVYPKDDRIRMNRTMELHSDSKKQQINFRRSSRKQETMVPIRREDGNRRESIEVSLALSLKHPQRGSASDIQRGHVSHRNRVLLSPFLWL